MFLVVETYANYNFIHSFSIQVLASQSVRQLANTNKKSDLDFNSLNYYSKSLF